MADPSSLLKTWLQRDKKLVTYRLLSRELRIHVDEAKKALSTYFESQKDKSDIDATYILIGRPTAPVEEKPAGNVAFQGEGDQDDDKLVGSSSTPGSSTAPARSFLDSRVTRRQTQADVARQVIRLVPVEQLDEARSAMEEVTSCHIYSISPGRLRDAAQLTAVQHDLHQQQKYVDTWQQTNRGVELGVILNPSIKDNYDPSKAIPSLGAASAPALGASKDTKSTNSSATKSQVKQEPDVKPSTMAKASTTAPSASAGSKKSGLDWSKAKSNQSDSKATAAVKREAPSSTKRPSARKALLGSDDEDDDDNSRRKPILVDDDDDDDDDKPAKLGYADDDSDDDIQMTDPIRGAAPRGTGKRADARSQTKSQQAAQRKELEAMMDTDDDDDGVQIVEPSGAKDDTKTGQGKDLEPDVEMADSTVTDTMNGTAAPKRRVRKKRKIGSKKVRSKDERGYTVTKTVDEYESYSSDESDAPVVVGSKRGTAAAKQQQAAASKETADSRSTSTSASASPAPSAPAKATPASNNSTLRKPSGGATPTPAKKGQQSLNSFFTRKPKN
ncbi:DNA polymerase subunit Cdc27 [Kalmanozyma brasiliensis GHG001]|uniref:DNA polymerase delta subunit 3 n=1 Tax=Kalmanozyma brasiliensis (strain GHG001) TaxID=1365824 RepID=V5EYV1_KALBG|nr:DNA polymerase subunit Cdc27 [Kalmanozyma brasiliensis GHG001]EST07999.1 DNA polymerase subunit Cdc27 [Kalmanozyma brasiliensis GHG001]